jgi:hypothetical protein
MFVWMLVVGCMSAGLNGKDPVGIDRRPVCGSQGHLFPGSDGAIHVDFILFNFVQGYDFHKADFNRSSKL